MNANIEEVRTANIIVVSCCVVIEVNRDWTATAAPVLVLPMLKIVTKLSAMTIVLIAPRRMRNSF